MIINRLLLGWVLSLLLPASYAEASSVVQTGYASFYAEDWADRPTASGEPFDPQALTAAHAGFPLGSWARVTNHRNGRSVVVKINDRNAPSHTRIIDLSLAAARVLKMVTAGVVEVTVERIGRPELPSMPPRKPIASN